MRDRDSGRRVRDETDQCGPNREEDHDVEEYADFTGRTPKPGHSEWNARIGKAVQRPDLCIAGVSVVSEQIVVPLCSTGPNITLSDYLDSFSDCSMFLTSFFRSSSNSLPASTRFSR